MTFGELFHARRKIIFFTWRGARKVRLNPYEIEMNLAKWKVGQIEMNIEKLRKGGGGYAQLLSWQVGELDLHKSGNELNSDLYKSGHELSLVLHKSSYDIGLDLYMSGNELSLDFHKSSNELIRLAQGLVMNLD